MTEFQGSRHGHAALFQGHVCANFAAQLHGGYGLMKAYVAERFYRDQKLLEIGEGTSYEKYRID